MTATLLSALLLLAPAVPAGAPAGPVCDRVVAIADQHGADRNFEALLSAAGLVDSRGAWADPRACLVQLGDVVDRGDGSRAILDRLMALEEVRPGRVEMVLGNHEVLTIVGDLRYASKGEFAAFASEETQEQREEGFRAFAEGRPDARREEFDALYPPGWFARRRAFSPEGRYGAWLLRRPLRVVREGSLFLHAGPGRAGVPGADDEGEVKAGIRAFLQARAQLEQEGRVSPLAPFAEVLALLPEEMRSALYLSPEGPLWNRELSQLDDAALEARLAPVLSGAGVSRVVAGHTPSGDGRVRVRLGGRALLADNGSWDPDSGAVPAAVEIRWDGRVRALTPTGPDPLVSPEVSDERLERFLLEGRVLKTEEIGKGITRPTRVELELDGRTMTAARKTVDLWSGERTRFKGEAAMQFADSYRHDRAAYVIDRLLGLRMVPPTVVRSLQGRPGALTAWVPDATDEEARRAGNLAAPDPVRMVRQRDRMFLFDALIGNPDRNMGNQLWTVTDWTLHLIDHSRAFRLDKTLRPAFLESPRVLPRALVERMAALDETRLVAAVGDVLSRAQVRAMLARRDLILAKIEEDRRRYGEAMVFEEAGGP